MDMVTKYIALHSGGRKNPICGSRIARAFGTTGVEIRRLVNIARCNGEPICSNGKGYYIACSKEELESTINSLEGRIAVMRKARDGLTRKLQTM